MKSLVITGLLGVCLGGCTSVKQFPVLDAKLVPEKKFDIAASASSRRYIPIENKTGNFNGFLTGFLQTDKYLYLTDNYSILKYTPDGKFVASIGNWGIEEGQYGMVYCMDLNATGDRLYVRTLDEMFVFDTDGKLLQRNLLDIPSKSYFDPEKKEVVVQKAKPGYRSRFCMSCFFITSQNNFLFKNPNNFENEVSILITDENLDSLGVIRNITFDSVRRYDVSPQFGTDRNYYYYQKTKNDTLYRLDNRLKEEKVLRMKNFSEPPIYPTKHVLLIGGVYYSLKSGKAVRLKYEKDEKYIRWLPIIGKGKHLYLQALATDILDNKEIITDPALKRICDTLTPESGVVIMDVKLNGLKF